MNCACGKPLHYSNDVTRRTVERMVEELGPYITVTVGKRTWKVQRHYIALHGLKADELPNLGFTQIRP